MANELQPMTFDYGDLDPTTVSTLESYAEKIRQTAAEGVLKIGAELAQVNELLAQKGVGGLWIKWVVKRCGFTVRTAQNYIAAHSSFNKCETISHLFQPTAMYVLSADSCPEEATKEAIKRAKKGETITAKVAKEIKEKYVEPSETETEESKPQGFDIDKELSDLINGLNETALRWPREDIGIFIQALAQVKGMAESWITPQHQDS